MMFFSTFFVYSCISFDIIRQPRVDLTQQKKFICFPSDNLIQMQGGKLKVIARGSNSELLCFSSEGEQVVLKVVSCGTKQHKHLLNQYTMLKELQHPRVVKALKFQEGLISQSNTMVRQFSEGKSVMVLEYAQGGSLLDFLKNKIGRDEKRKVLAEIIEGVGYLHGKGIAHRDLKLENVLVFKESREISVKLADFGFATKVKKNQENLVFKQYKGTRRGYMAPEIHICRQNPTPYDPMSSDIFALGVILFAVMLGRLPFEIAVPENKVFNMLKEGKLAEFWAFHQIQLLTKDWKELELISFKSLFENMCAPEPKDRITIEEINQSEWIKAGL